jgi:hypothetical protein
MPLPTVTIDYIPVLLATIVSMVIGFLWFSALFGKVWMREMKFTAKDMAAAKKKGMGKNYMLVFITTFITAYVLAHFVQYLNLTTATAGLQLGFWIWLGFFATTQLGMVLWENKSWTLYIVTTLHNLVSLLVMSSILVAW